MWLSSPPKTVHLKMVHLDHPPAYVKYGRLSQIIFKQQQIWFANCAFMQEALQAVCQQNSNKNTIQCGACQSSTLHPFNMELE
ncbi:hypothetical protein B9T29_09755 [Acinetobacter sp. ANC 3903]|nr:hypothetical protein B9T29_09755 [Acinetobacter sp. ANC 3903]